jgi:hypothetical protein
MFITRLRSFLLQRLILFVGLNLMFVKLDPPIVLELYDHSLFQWEHIDDSTLSTWCDNALFPLRETFASLRILLIFIDQAAAQATAHSSNLLRIKGYPLSLCHFNGYRAELR